MKVYLISPKEPSGITWLINCLLELGIKVYRNNANSMWVLNEDGTYKLSEKENILKKWLPILSKKNRFKFVDGLEAEWTHDWPLKKYADQKSIFFTRDLRDSLFSRYKRENPNISYFDFARIPDQNTLLNKIDNWVLYNYLWKALNVPIYRFEDYKKDDLLLLNTILKDIGVTFDEEKIKSAALESTYKKAVQSEKEYLINNLDTKETINRVGKANEWMETNDSDRIKINQIIEQKGPIILKELGYKLMHQNLEKIPIHVNPNLSYLNFFNSLIQFDKTRLNSDIFDFENQQSNIQYINNYIYGLDEKAKDLYSLDKFSLLSSLNEFTLSHAAEVNGIVFREFKKTGATHSYLSSATRLLSMKLEESDPQITLPIFRWMKLPILKYIIKSLIKR